MSVSFHELARRELNEAAEYYDSESGRAGTGVRRRLIRRFPYALLYRMKATEIRILAVMNLKRRPAYWVGRS